MTNLPPYQDHPAAWTGDELRANPGAWHLTLSPEQAAEIGNAADAWLASGRPLSEIDAAGFPLPGTADLLDTIRTELTAGQGFRLLSGLDVSGWPREKAAAAFLGFGAHIGRVRSQNAKGHLLGHVKDLGLASADPNVRIYQTSERQTFHTDSADVVGLLCLNEAREGGDSLLVSGVSIFNEMHARRPDLLAELMKQVATDRRGEVPAGADPYYMIPVFSWHQGALTVMYQRQYIESAQRFPDAPRLTDAYRAALDLFDDMANDPALNVSMRLRPGDMQFVHNHTMLHDRTGFVDWEEPEKRRHLLRLWLSVPEDRALPDIFAERFGSTTPGNRGGIVVPGTQFQVPLDAA